MKKIVFVFAFLLTISFQINAQWFPQNSTTSIELRGTCFISTSEVYAVGHEGTIVKSTDGGISWSLQTSNTTNNLTSVHFSDTNNGTAVGANGTILRTTDGGSNWNLQTTNTSDFFMSVYYTDTNNGTVVGYNGTIFRTTDAGITWVAQASGTTNTLVGVYFTDINHGTVVGSSGTILRTTDGGDDWTIQSSGTTINLSGVVFTDINKGIVAGFGGIILQTNDGGSNWSLQTISPYGLTSIHFSDSNNGIVVGSNGIIFRTTDAGDTWIAQSSGTDLLLRGVSFIDPNVGLVVGRSGLILRTINGGYSLSPPVLSTVPNGSINQPLNLQLTWFPVSDATNYSFQLSSDSTFSNVIIDLASIEDTFFNVASLLNSVVYYWRVKSNFPTSSSEWSEVWDFTTRSTILQVPSDYSTIQAAINASVNGDTVLVQPGTYYERINFNGKAIIVGSTYLISNDTSLISSTIIDGNHQLTVVTFNQNENNTTKLIGFTIQNGFYNGGNSIYNGAGILVDDANPEISHCIVKDNYISWYGGGICIKHSTGAIINSVIIKNNYSEHHGGGLAILNANPKLYNLLVYGNSTGERGGGIYVGSIPRPELINCTIVNNSAVGYASHYGGGISTNSGSNMVVINNIIWSNTPNNIDDEFDVTQPVFYSNVQGGYVGTGNINDDPKFMNASSNDFRISDYSPSIGIGVDSLQYSGTWFKSPDKDFNLNPRPKPAGSNPDHGAFENSFGTQQHKTLVFVPGDYSSIQEAINERLNGDTVLVAPGTYQENIDLSTKSILLTSNVLFGRDTNIVNQTKILAQNILEPTIKINGSGKVLGFSVQSGNGGISIGIYSSPHIEFCSIYSSIGVGIWASNSDIEILDCKIFNNLDIGVSLLGCTGSLMGSKLFNNNGSGLHLWAMSGNFEIENNIFFNNIKGVSTFSQNPATIINCTFFNNQYGIFCQEGSAFTIKNSILFSTGVPILINSGGVHILNIDYSIIENGQNGIINNSTTSLVTYGDNNINYDPHFINENNYDLHLSNFSPAIGSGTSIGSPLFDIEGNFRPNPVGSTPDIGAYEVSLAHFSLLSPVLASVQNGSVYQPTNIQLKWDSVYAATSYRFQFSTDSTFQTTLVDQSNIADTFFNLFSLDYLTEYYWRVNATYPYDTSSWSDVWNFTTIIEVPEIPTLLSPVNNSFNHTTDISFSWSSALRAEKYDFQLATDTLFQNIIVIDTSIVGTSRVVTGISYNANYFWKVRAKNIGGNSGYSTIWNFRTKLQTPVLQSPANNSQNITINPTLTWSTVAGAANYHLQIALDHSFNQIIFNDSLLTNASAQVGPLLNSTIYYWRVKGYSGIYTSDFPTGFTFTTIISNPNFPVLLSPGNGSVNQPLNTTFMWEPVALATAYKLQVSTDSLFGSFIINDSSITTTSKFTNLPNNNQKYFWRVQAKNVGGNSPFSSEWHLITFLPAPSLTSINPGNKIVLLNWNQLPLSNLFQHNIYRNITPDPTQMVLSVSFNQTSFTDTGLTNGVTYYYRVKTVSVYGVESEYSNQLSAVPNNSPPVAVVLNPQSFPNEGRVLTREVSFSSAGSFDPDGTIDSTKWYVNDDFISYGNNLTYPFPQGTHSITLVVFDNDGESDTSSTTVTRSMFTKNVNGQVVAGLSLIGSNILYAIVNGDAMYRMDKDGNIDYTLQVGGNLLASSSIANDSTVYLGSTDNNIYAFSKSGTSLWVRPLGGAVTTTPTIDILNDRVYVGVSNRNFQFLNRSNGNVLGNYFSDSPINTSAVITSDNRLFFSTVKGTMYGFDLASISFPNVIPTWTITSSDTISSSPAIDAEGFFYVGTKNGLLKKISMQSGLQGTVVWQANLGGTISASPVIDASGNIYVGSTNNDFYAVNRETGSIKWSYPFGGQIKTTAAISEDANIYFGTDNGYVFCVDTLGTTLWQYNDSSSICTSLLYSDGVLYLGTLDGRLVALYDQIVTEGQTVLANNIWSTFQGNNQRTGEQADRLTNINGEDYSSTPTEYAVFDNFPNPFNPSTVIRYALPFQSKVKIEVYNILGELVKNLIDLEQAPGYYDIIFDASGLSSGIYIYRIVAQSMNNKNQFAQVKKMILMK